ncbi:uncharacterized protein LOC120425272 isoform X1 [Culex pipiens pallens]|uniref:uncharacterized protein LOC120425272 isoform X1 n=2 Tax=Culex pipiens pallens TaxID=42434 RepID=UPI001954387D|nr:uncharacterized protein LOC120425272 isoform X1 [Culex pipiens pallens]
MALDKMSAVDGIKHELQELKESLNQAECENLRLKELLKEMALAKQTLANELWGAQSENAKLTKKLSKQKHIFTVHAKTQSIEMNRIGKTLEGLQNSLRTSNRQMARHMQRCSSVRSRLGTIFLRMWSTKQWHLGDRNRYQRMCLQFAEYVREQNRYLQATVDAKLSVESIASCHRQYLNLLTRCSQLLHENMGLRLLAVRDESSGSIRSRLSMQQSVDSNPDGIDSGNDSKILVKKRSSSI